MDIIDSLGQIVPLKYQVAGISVSLFAKWLAELYSAVVNGGGLKRIVCAFIYGENVPKVIAKDYKAELNTSAPKADTPPTP
jgi:hypothetical protein